MTDKPTTPEADDLALNLGEDPTPAPVSTTSDPAPVDVDEDDEDGYPLGEGVDEERATGLLALYDARLLRYVATGPEVSALFDEARAQGHDVDDLDRYSVRRV